MNESITRAAGANHGQEVSAEDIKALITAAGRVPKQRRTDYSRVDPVRQPQPQAELTTASG